ncbi:hypothetical protein [Selenomonas flueggei]|uniref:Uncharacterized protein n=1 Tax=Selenomonas flueggei ATCC 43531 TaxID=638302 RepID=C4V5D3_9FIRM|nr:hypothetical protein [Selenomonas flueggei]EEQ48012.1 hypothetical protein HMPREF0908_1727 [Selenomonas flueggei ATCC 43531]
MHLVKSIAAVTVTVLTLTGTASAADGIGGSERRDTIQEYKTYEEAEAAIRKHLDEEAENAKRVPLSVDECRVIVMNDALYKDIDRSALPPVDQPMPALSALFSSLLYLSNLQLVVTEGREARTENTIRTGYPTRWFRTVDSRNAKRYHLSNGKQVIMSLALEIVHKKDATKSFANDFNFFIYDADDHPLMRISGAQLPDLSHAKSTAESLNIIAAANGTPLTEGDREYALAQHMLQTAMPAEIPRK